MNKLAMILATISVLSCGDVSAEDKFNKINIEEMSILTMQKHMNEGTLTSKQLVELYLNRIEKYDSQLNAVIELNPDALKIASDMDEERANGKVRSPMHGIPFMIKDNIETADKMKTTAGSLALVNAPTPEKDAFIIQQLRKSGAVLVGKTNLSEWANFRSNNSSSGWSSRGGQTHNPYILDRSPCGSSSGSGVAVSANLISVAVGTETDGSIVCPASINGIVGIKPTLGLLSRSGIIPLAHSQDTSGPMAKTVSDAVIMFQAMVAKDVNDSVNLLKEGEIDFSMNYNNSLDKNGLKGARIGVARQYFGKNAQLDALMTQQLNLMKQKGALLIDVEFPDLENFGEDEYGVLLYEFKNDINKYLKNRGGKYDSLEKLIQFNKTHADKQMPYFEQEIFEKAQAMGSLDDDSYKKSLKNSKYLTQDKGIDMVMDKHQLDAIFAPTNTPSWMIDLIYGDSFGGFVSSSSLAAVSGYPSITVPSGFIKKMPIGFSFIGRAYSEAELIKIAYAWEQASMARRKPTLLKTYQ
ncbi:MAG: amidase [Marinicellaceae bacterium]